jgi:hypothetical protein
VKPASKPTSPPGREGAALKNSRRAPITRSVQAVSTSAPTPSRPARIKGLALVELVKGIRLNQGDPALARMVASMPTEVRSQLHPGRENLGVLTGAWYPAAILNSFYDQLVVYLTASERRDLAETIGRWYVEKLLRGIYRLIFEALMTPERYVAHAQRLWDQGNDSGKLAMTLVDPFHIVGRIYDWHGHHPFGCEVAHQIGFHVFVAMGCKGVHSDLQCKSQTGKGDCSGTYAWDIRPGSKGQHRSVQEEP